MQELLINQVKSSNSNDKLKEIIKEIPSFHHHTHILYDVRHIISKEKVTYMEIGSYCGASAALVLSHPGKTVVHCIDPLNLPKSHYKGQHDQLTMLQNALKEYKDVNIHQGYSQDTKILNEVKDVKVDMLFIDGDHSYNGVRRDFNNYSPLVVSGGFIIFDDYLDAKHSPEVRKAVDDLVKDLEGYEIIGSLPNYQNAYSGIPKTHLNEFILYKL